MPDSINEYYLQAIVDSLDGEGGTVVFRDPQSANEALLQNILGAENEIREPQSVIETLLKEIWEGGFVAEESVYNELLTEKFGT